MNPTDPDMALPVSKRMKFPAMRDSLQTGVLPTPQSHFVLHLV
jgi:hypothetical protein